MVPPPSVAEQSSERLLEKEGEMLSSKTCKYVETLLLNRPKSVSRMFM